MSTESPKDLIPQDAASRSPATGILERFDLADNRKIIEALSKVVTTGFTYKVNGKFGLSSSGTLWACREFAKYGEVYRVVGNVDIKPCPLDPDCVNVTLVVQRFFVNPATGQEIALDSTIGHKRMSRKAKRYTDQDDPSKFEMVEDPEFITKAITKAERNGKLKLLPKDAVTTLIAKATGQTAGPTPPPRSSQKPSGQATPTTSPPSSTGAPPAQAAPPTQPPPAQPKPTAPPASQAQAAAPAPAPTPPPAQAAPAPAPAPAAPLPGAQPPKPAPPPPMTREVKIQKLDAVSKLVFQTSDPIQARLALAKLTGRPSPTDLSDDEIKAVGNAMNSVANKKAAFQGNNIVRLEDNAVLWKGPELQPPAAQAPPVEEEMF